jgi:hypothetical protein
MNREEFLNKQEMRANGLKVLREIRSRKDDVEKYIEYLENELLDSDQRCEDLYERIHKFERFLGVINKASSSFNRFDFEDIKL